MNSFSKSVNRDYSFEFLPGCEVRWVTAANQARILKPNKAIIKLSFSGDDHDLNFYNAAQAYVETGLLPDTRPFLVRTTAKAIDLLMIRMLLTQSRRNALRIFNTKFVEQEDAAKTVYLKLEESDRESLFRQLLLPELHVFGQSVAQKTPSAEIQAEIERFLDWFYEIATRPAGEFTKLSFASENIKVGVILVADLETFDRFGVRPYLRRANLHAGRDYQCVYILARGQRRADIASRIGRELVGAGGYSQLNRKTVSTIHKGAEAYLVTCIALKPDKIAIVANAWRKLEEDFKGNRPVVGTIEYVTEDSVQVDIYGLRFDLTRDQLSSVEIGAAYLFFQRDQELELRILQCNAADQAAELSNRETSTDPKNIVDLVNEAAGRSVAARVEQVIRSRDIDIGWALVTTLGDKRVKAFLPRRGATFSRFIALEEKFPIGSQINVIIEKFDFSHGSLRCRLEGTRDPWDPVPQLRIGLKVTAVIREITENHATCEIEEGLEARLFHEELSWDTPDANRRKMGELQPGQTIEGVVTRFDPERQHISISAKRLTKSETETYFDAHRDASLEVEIKQVGRFDAIVSFVGTSFVGHIKIRDVMWGYCTRLSDHLHGGQRVSVKCLDYDARSDIIHAGIKQLERNDFSVFEQRYKANAAVQCEVIGVGDQSIRVRVMFNGHQAFGYIHRAEVSWTVFVDDEIARKLFQTGDRYHCQVKRFDAENSLIEFSRKMFLAANHRTLQYGSVLKARIVLCRKEPFGYGDLVEGRIVRGLGTKHTHPLDVEVMVSRKGNSPREVELAVA
jgi:small subunit ribosomal protein S1